MTDNPENTNMVEEVDYFFRIFIEIYATVTDEESSKHCVIQAEAMAAMIADRSTQNAQTV